MDFTLAVKEALESPETLATPLMAIVRKVFGDDAFFWDPTTIYLECRDEFGAELPTETMDRISAGQVAVSGNAFFEDISAFLNICNTLPGGHPSFDVFDPVEPEEAAWGLVEVSLLRDMQPFAPTIKAYVRTMLNQNGYGPDDYPAVFAYVFGGKPPRKREIIEHTLHDDQSGNIEAFVKENLEAMVYQFDQIPGFGGVMLELLHDKDVEDLAALRPMTEVAGEVRPPPY